MVKGGEVQEVLEVGIHYSFSMNSTHYVIKDFSVRSVKTMYSESNPERQDGCLY